MNLSLATKYGGTIQRWFRMWKQNRGCFPNPHYVRNGKTSLPQLLQNYPNLHRSLVKEMEDNLAHLSGEFVFHYLVDTGLPNILEERRKELENEDFTTCEILQENGLTKLTLSTIYRWMHAIGFKYKEKKILLC